MLDEHGKISEEEINSLLMQMNQSKRGYLMERLRAILSKRTPAEAEKVRMQYFEMMKELEAEEAAKAEEEKEQNKGEHVDKMLRFLENYMRVQESHNLKKHQTLQAIVSADERIRRQQEEKEIYRIQRAIEANR